MLYFLSDMNNFERVNSVYASYFSAQYPVRETVEVSCLPKKVNVEISFIAEKVDAKLNLKTHPKADQLVDWLLWLFLDF